MRQISASKKRPSALEGNTDQKSAHLAITQVLAQTDSIHWDAPAVLSAQRDRLGSHSVIESVSPRIGRAIREK
jgi:hypothetical protein